MGKFRLCAKVTVSAYTEIEANTAEEAIKLAKGRSAEIAGFGGDSTECWMIDEADGMPEEIQLED